jgi:hypothetical protein
MSRYVRDYDGIGKMLRGEGPVVGLRTDLWRRARRVRAAAVRGSGKDTGAYAAAWQITQLDRGGVHKDRFEVQVFNDDEAAPFQEFGNGNNVPPHVLLKALTEAKD